MSEAAPACPSCAVPYEQHLGLNGTCAKLRATRRLLVEAIDMLDRLTCGDGNLNHTLCASKEVCLIAKRYADEMKAKMELLP